MKTLHRRWEFPVAVGHGGDSVDVCRDTRRRKTSGKGGHVLADGVYRDGRPEMLFTFTVDIEPTL